MKRCAIAAKASSAERRGGVVLAAEGELARAGGGGGGGAAGSGAGEQAARRRTATKEEVRTERRLPPLASSLTRDEAIARSRGGLDEARARPSRVTVQLVDVTSCDRSPRRREVAVRWETRTFFGTR